MSAGQSSYSFIRHLAWSVWLNHDPAECWMAMFTGYYDASGTELDEGSPLVVAGVVGTVERWLEFERGWDAALRDFGVPYLHMKDFTQFRGPYESWHGEEQRRVEFLDRLLRVLKLAASKAFVLRVLPSDFAAVNQRYQLAASPWPTPYPFVALMCTAMTEHWMASKHPSDAYHHVIEHGDCGQEIMSLYDRTHVGDLTIKRKVDRLTGRWFAPFQAADLVAYENRLAIKRKLEGDHRPLRRSFQRLREMIPHQTAMYGRKELFAMCRDHPELYPQRTEPNVE